MARAASEKVGLGVCPSIGCGAEVVYRKSSGGLLTHRCDRCDSHGFCEPGGDAYAARVASITSPARAPAADPAPVGAPAPVPAKKRAAFALGDL